jgi:hypothetical protein
VNALLLRSECIEVLKCHFSHHREIVSGIKPRTVRRAAESAVRSLNQDRETVSLDLRILLARGQKYVMTTSVAKCKIRTILNNDNVNTHHY